MTITKTNFDFVSLKAIPFTKALFVVFICFGSCFSYAQTCSTSSDLSKEDAWSRLVTVYDFGGSTFVACKTGMITSVRFKVTKASAAQPNAYFFLENGFGVGVEGYQSVAAYNQTTSIAGNGKMTTIKLKTPFPVKKGEMYTWYVQKDPDAGPLVQAAAMEPNNKFSTGATWYNNEIYPAMDNMFTVKIR